MLPTEIGHWRGRAGRELGMFVRQSSKPSSRGTGFDWRWRWRERRWSGRGSGREESRLSGRGVRSTDAQVHSQAAREVGRQAPGVLRRFGSVRAAGPRALGSSRLAPGCSRLAPGWLLALVWFPEGCSAVPELGGCWIWAATWKGGSEGWRACVPTPGPKSGSRGATSRCRHPLHTVMRPRLVAACSLPVRRCRKTSG